MITEAQFAKLPKWARREIERLTANMEEANSRLDALSSPDAAVIAEPYSEHPIGFPERTHVSFRVKGGTIDVAIRDGFLKIYGSDLVLIQPESANTFKVAMGRMDK